MPPFRAPLLLALLGAFLCSAAAHVAPLLPDSRLPRPAQQYDLPFAGPPGPDTWLLGQYYGNTSFAYQQRGALYRNGQGIHFGLDLSAPCGTPVHAIADGVVSEVDGPHGSPPHNLVIDHPDGLSSLYGHLLKKSFLRVGAHVKRGQVVAYSGDSQLSCQSQPHLHLEIRDHSHQRLFNPAPYLNADWASLALVDPDMDGGAFERDLRDPLRWQTLQDQPAARLQGPLLNAYPEAWPPAPASLP